MIKTAITFYDSALELEAFDTAVSAAHTTYTGDRYMLGLIGAGGLDATYRGDRAAVHVAFGRRTWEAMVDELYDGRSISRDLEPVVTNSRVATGLTNS